MMFTIRPVIGDSKTYRLMKTISKIFVAAVAVLGLFACNKETVAPNNNEGFVDVTFLANAQSVKTKATLTPDEADAVFTSAWETGDELSVEYLNYAGEGVSGIVTASWNGKSFDTAIKEGLKGEWSYDAIFPAPNQSKSVDFGSLRTQKGNLYSSRYDLMEGDVFCSDAEAGKTDEGESVKFQMNRQTGIVYFHFKSSLAEESVVSATLSVEGGYIASSSIEVKDYAKGYDLSTRDLNSITLTFDEGTAPTADDFNLWFNVLPTDYTSLTLAVETTGHTATITNATAGKYEAGQLYKVAGNIDSKLVAKPVVEDKVFFYESFDTNDGTGGNDGKWKENGTATSAIKYDNDGWVATSGNGGNACVKLGSSKNQGMVTTPVLGITSTSATIWFKAGAWDGDAKKITLSASGSATISPDSFDLENAAWTDCFCTISGADETTKITIKASLASKNRFFLDEVYVYTGKKPTVKANQTISFAPTEYSCFVDDAFTAPELNGAKTTVTYSSSDENVATVDATTGAVTIIAAGSTTIKASAEETEEYRSASASYKLTVNKRTQTIGFEKSYYSVTVADKDNFASPKVSGAATEVTYSITLADGTAADAMAIDSQTGEITINAVGTATVTATAAETSIYKGSSASYTLKVIESASPETVSYEIVFKTANNDSSSETKYKDALSALVSEGSDYVSSFTSNCSKMYLGVSGVKIGSSSVAGTLELKLTDAVSDNVVSIQIVSAKYGSDTGKLTLSADGKTLKSGIAPASGYTHTFATPTKVSTLTLKTSTKRAYISKIIITVSSK